MPLQHSCATNIGRPFAGDLEAADARLRPKLTALLLQQIVRDVPEAWLTPEDEFAGPAEQRQAYITYLTERLNGRRAWLAEAITAQQRGPKPLTRRQTHRVV